MAGKDSEKRHTQRDLGQTSEELGTEPKRRKVPKADVVFSIMKVPGTLPRASRAVTAVTIDVPTPTRERPLESYPHRLRPDEQPEEFEEFTKLFDQQVTVCRLFVHEGSALDYHRVEEAVSNALLISYRRWNAYKDDGENTRWKWFMRISRNSIETLYKKEARRPQRVRNDEVNELALALEAGKELLPDETIVRRIDHLDKTLRGNPHKEILIALANGMSQQEIADTLEVSPSTVHNYIVAGTNHLTDMADVYPEDSEEDRQRKIGIFLSNGGISERAMEVEEGIGFVPKMDTGVPVEIQRAGWYAKQAREGHGILGVQVTEHTGINFSNFYNFETGNRSLELNRVYKGLIACGIRPTDHRMEKINKIRESRNWLRTLSRGDMTLDRAIYLLALSTLKSDSTFAKESGMSDPGDMSRYKTDRNKPSPDRLNSMLIAANIDPRSKEGRMFHLLSNEMSPLSADKFAEALPKDQVKYLRVQSGVTQSKLGDQIYYDDSSVARFESGEMTMTEPTLKVFCESVGIKENGAVYDIMLRRIGGTTVDFTQKDRMRLLSDSFVFAEHVQRIQKYSLFPEEETLSQSMIDMPDQIGKTGNMLSLLTGDLPQTELHKRSSIGIKTIYNTQNGFTIPKDFIIMRWLMALGYDSNHPIAQYTLECSRKEREERKSSPSSRHKKADEKI